MVNYSKVKYFQGSPRYDMRFVCSRDEVYTYAFLYMLLSASVWQKIYLLSASSMQWGYTVHI